MEYVTLGRTNLMVSRSALGTKLLQDVSEDDFAEIINTAYNSGINFFDTSSSYSNVELKLGHSIYSKREAVIISSGTKAVLGKDATLDLELSLENLNTDTIDIYHITNDDYLPVPGTDDSLYNEMLKARRDGKIKFIGFTTHKLSLAQEAISSGLYDVVRYPINVFSSEEELALIKQAEQAEIGIVAIKTLCSGKIDNVPLAFGFLRQYENLVCVWGTENNDDIVKLIYFESNPPKIDEQFKAELEELKKVSILK